MKISTIISFFYILQKYDKIEKYENVFKRMYKRRKKTKKY